MKKRILIFGAGGKLGLAVAKAFKGRGFGEIILFDRHPEKLNKFSEAKIIKVSNLTDEHNVEELFKTAGVNEGGEDFLFSSIGGFYGGEEISELELGVFEKMLKLNLEINFLLAKYFVRNLAAAKSGSILFTSALSSFLREAGKSAYVISKAALNNLVEILAEEGKGKNFTVNAIAPFVLDTPENREWIEDETMLVSPEDISRLVLSLFDNYRIISGNIIKLPGTI